MPPLDDKDRDVVLNYLEAAYPPRAPTGRGGWQNPFAKWVSALCAQIGIESYSRWSVWLSFAEAGRPLQTSAEP